MTLALALCLFQAHATESTNDIQNSTQTQEQPSSRLSPKVKVVAGIVGATVALYGAYVAYMNRDLIQDRFSRAYDGCTWSEAEALQKTVQDGFVNGAVYVKDTVVDAAQATKEVVVDTKNWIASFFSTPEIQ